MLHTAIKKYIYMDAFQDEVCHDSKMANDSKSWTELKLIRVVLHTYINMIILKQLDMASLGYILYNIL